MKKQSKILSATLAMIMTLSLTACGASGEREKKVEKSNNLTQNIESVEVETKEVDDEFVSVTADFSVDIFKQSALEDISLGKNVLISPHSIITAMSMTTNGASGNTLTQLEDVMYGGMSVTEYNKYIQDYSGRLTRSRDVDFHMANSIWINDYSLNVNQDFLQICKAYYDADVYREVFDEKTTNKINDWVADNTNDMIDSIINKIPQDAVMYLINALAFEGEWSKQYEDYQIEENATFTNSFGVEEKVTMLNSTEKYLLQDDMARGFMKYYKGGEYAFVAMLPDEGVSMEEYVGSLTGEKLMDTYNNRENHGNIVVSMPEFTYDYERELSNDLKALGVTDSFDGDRADLSEMAHSDSGNLFIGRVLHKTYIKNDRYGTKAAAVTAVEIKNETACEPSTIEKVILDRPFYYAIIDCKTGLPVFMGVVNSIK